MSVPFIEPQDQVILFDGVCKLCTAWSRFIIRYDTQFRFKLCSVQSKKGQALLQHYGYPTEYYPSMIYIENGKACQQSSAFIKVMCQMPWPFKLLAVSWIIPKPIRDWLYDRVALNRYQLFGKHAQCLLPSQTDRKRFL